MGQQSLGALLPKRSCVPEVAIVTVIAFMGMSHPIRLSAVCYIEN